MNKYYNVVAIIDNEVEILFGSFLKSECVYELDAEKDSWKGQGYKKIKVIGTETIETPDPKIYSKKDLIEINNQEGDYADYFNKLNAARGI